jgi:hypothetical protein
MQSERYMGSAGGQLARRPSSFKAVGAFVPKLVRESFRRRGFVNIDIVLRWREIVGDALARETWPVRIDWPRRQETVLRPDGTEAPGTHRTRVVVGASPARALEVEYAKRAIIDRVNGYLGYRAATELVAAPDYSMPPEQRKPAVRIATAEVQAEADPLCAALARLGRSVARRR